MQDMWAAIHHETIPLGNFFVLGIGFLTALVTSGRLAGLRNRLRSSPGSSRIKVLIYETVFVGPIYM